MTLADPPTHSIESTFPGWLDNFFKTIDTLAPAAPAELLSRLSLSSVPPARIQLEKVTEDSIKMDPVPPPWSSDVRWAKVKENERTTAPGWYQDVRSVELEVEGLDEEQVL